MELFVLMGIEMRWDTRIVCGVYSTREKALEQWELHKKRFYAEYRIEEQILDKVG